MGEIFSFRFGHALVMSHMTATPTSLRRPRKDDVHMKKAPDWERAGQAVEKRIGELGVPYRGIAKRADVDPSTLWKVRTGAGCDVSETVRRKLDVALQWPQGTIDRVAVDRRYEPPVAVLTDPERLSALEASVTDLRKTVADLNRQIRRLLADEGSR